MCIFSRAPHVSEARDGRRPPCNKALLASLLRLTTAASTEATRVLGPLDPVVRVRPPNHQTFEQNYLP